MPHYGMVVMPALENKRHEAFVQEYLRNGRNARSAYKATYKVNDGSAGSAGALLLNNIKLQRRLEELNAIATERVLKGTVDARVRIIEEFQKIGFANVIDAYGKPIKKLDRDLGAAIKSIRKDKNGNDIVEFYDKSDALKTMGQMYGMFDTDQTVPIPGSQVNVNIAVSNKVERVRRDQPNGRAEWLERNKHNPNK